MKRAALLMGLAFLLPSLAKAAGTVSWDPVTGLYSLAWEAVDPSTDTADVEYRIYMDSGNVYPTTLVDTVYENKATIFPPSLSGGLSEFGPYSFRVRSFDSVDLAKQYPVLNETQSFLTFYERGDASGSQVGRNQQWRANVRMQGDALIYAAIYPPFTTFALDLADPLNVTYNPSNPPVKVIADGVPFSGVGKTGFEYTLPWDSRNSSGTIVPNGIYTMMIEASDNSGVLDTGSVSFPVDIMRFMSLSATGITATAPQATITYDINAPGFVTLLFCSTGTRFIQATTPGNLVFTAGGLSFTYTYTSGDNLPADALGALDATRLLRVMKFYREEGIHTETWNGTDQSSATLARGIYTFAINMKDDYGNVAVEASGNDGPLAGTISIDVNSPSAGGGGGTPPPSGGGDTTAPVISAISPANGTTVTTSLGSVSAVLTDAGGINWSASSIRLRRDTPAPAGILPGNQTNNSATGVITYTLTTPLGRADNGTYSVIVSANDMAGLSTPALTAFTLTVLDPNVFTSGATLYSYPNPVNDIDSGMTIAFDTTRAVTMTLQIYNILGELIHEESFVGGPGPGTQTWNLTNRGGERLSSGIYIYRLKGEDESGKQEIKKKFVVVR